MDLSEFKASLVYRVSSRTIMLQKETLSREKQTDKQPSQAEKQPRLTKVGAAIVCLHTTEYYNTVTQFIFLKATRSKGQGSYILCTEN